MTRNLIAILVAGALLAGCGGNNSPEPGRSPEPGQRSGGVEAQLGLSQRGIESAHARVETDIAACMKAQGFQYTPVDPVSARAALTGKSNLSDDELQQQFGYGIATLYGRGSAQTDPNAVRRQALSAADRRAYDRALSGGQPDQTFVRAADTGDFSKLGGCTKQATERAFGGGRMLTTVVRKLDELDDAILQDQRMVRAQEAWTACVRGATGETFEDSEAVELEIQRRLADVVGPLPSGESAPGAFANEQPKPGYDEAALEQLRRQELDLSDADVSCEEQHITDVEDTVRAEKEAGFRDANAELLRQVRPLGG